ncbi:MAG: bifunctional riboflavin kinase/FAD synthetase [Ruminococcaceae bacterium]|nr:bifunctional riboflavin kinase/FAD synthetase [Oscillospiraceae bacterium]
MFQPFFSECPPLKEGQSLAIALGNFDGVHLGHLSLIEAAIAETKKENGVFSAVWSFAEHTSLSLDTRPSVDLITLPEEKCRLFGAAGVDFVLTDRFDALRDLSPEEFVRDILIQKYRCSVAVCGFNFRFGRFGAGTPETLDRLMRRYGGRALIMPPFEKNGGIVSSSRIRSLIENGQTEEAAELLGRPFSIRFPVLHGQKLGRTIGIPTINQLFPAGMVRPQNGIYACTVSIGGEELMAVSNVGSRPTVNADESAVNCETHILHYNGWLYGQSIRVSFYKKLREETKFASVEELKQAVERDIGHTELYFKEKERSGKEVSLC